MSTTSTEFSETKKYRIHFQYKNWIGKPDPSGMGKAYYYSDDPGWITDQCSWLKQKGNKVLSVQKRVGKVWRKM